MRRLILPLTVVTLLLLIGFAGPVAESDEGYDLSWWTVDGRGWTFSEGGDYVLGGTIGQPDRGVLQGGDCILGGGFWAGIRADYNIYLPLVLKNYP